MPLNTVRNVHFDTSLTIDAILLSPFSLSVYDFSFWALDDSPGAHPGNMMAAMHGHHNPIKKWRDVNASAILVYPAVAQPHHPELAPHPIERWNTYSPKFSKLGR